jgi:hypothetical protein
MIPLVIFYLHIVLATAAFTKSWQDSGLTDGILTLAFVGLIFVVGWSIASFIIGLCLPREVSAVLNTDSLSLILLASGEACFYYFYFLSHKK